MSTDGYVPYAWSVGICYLLNLLCLFAGVHVLASALAERNELGDEDRPRWWRLRYWPMLVCCLPIAHTLMRGQVNILILACLCAALAGWLRGWNFRAGLWLSLAICIKVIPVYLLVYPVWKRDYRALAGCTVGLLIGRQCLVSRDGSTRIRCKQFFGALELNLRQNFCCLGTLESPLRLFDRSFKQSSFDTVQGCSVFHGATFRENNFIEKSDHSRLYFHAVYRVDTANKFE